MNNSPKAIGFDLFNTLLTAHPDAMPGAQKKLLDSLEKEGLPVEAGPFRDAYLTAAARFLEETRKDGRETHNRFWIAAALESNGYSVSPEDPRISRIVEAYFSAFYPHCRLIPGTLEILEELSGRYRLGLLTNFTHTPAVQEIMNLLDLPRFFQAVIISGEVGYRKPHPRVFRELLDQLGEPGDRVLFVGDDLEADVQGAGDAGLRPVLTSMVKALEIPSALTPLSPQHTDCPPDVPEISAWEDLLALLEE
jgi:putative hydrolase of the HAD superfamily